MMGAMASTSISQGCTKKTCNKYMIQYAAVTVRTTSIGVFLPWKWRCFFDLNIIGNACRFTSAADGRWSAPCPVGSTTWVRCRRWVSSTPGDEAPGSRGGGWLLVGGLKHVGIKSDSLMSDCVFRWFPRLLKGQCQSIVLSSGRVL